MAKPRKYTCVYCGDFAEDREHVVPSSYFENSRSFRYPGNIVPACRRCNTFASNKVFDTFAEKKEYIKSRYIVKFKSYFLMPIWSDEEIGELSGTLKRKLQGAVNKQRALAIQVQNLNNPNPIEE